MRRDLLLFVSLLLVPPLFVSLGMLRAEDTPPASRPNILLIVADDLAADPYEKHDLAGAEAGRVAELQALLAAERAKDVTQLRGRLGRTAEVIDAP